MNSYNKLFISFIIIFIYRHGNANLLKKSNHLHTEH